MPRESGSNRRKSIAGIREVTHIEDQPAKRVPSPGYSGRLDARRESKRRSSSRIEWKCGLGESNFAKNRRGAFQRARGPEQPSSTLDGLHASSVAVAVTAAYIVWWLRDANRC